MKLCWPAGFPGRPPAYESPVHRSASPIYASTSGEYDLTSTSSAVQTVLSESRLYALFHFTPSRVSSRMMPFSRSSFTDLISSCKVLCFSCLPDAPAIRFSISASSSLFLLLSDQSQNITQILDHFLQSASTNALLLPSPALVFANLTSSKIAAIASAVLKSSSIASSKLLLEFLSLFHASESPASVSSCAAALLREEFQIIRQQSGYAPEHVLGRLHQLCAEIQRTSVMCAQHEETKHLQIIFLADLTNSKEIAQRFGHLTVINIQECIMHPVIEQNSLQLQASLCAISFS